MGLLLTSTICLSINCPVCGTQLSGHNRRGFKDFMLSHMQVCGAEDFGVQESIAVERMIVDA